LRFHLGSAKPRDPGCKGFLSKVRGKRHQKMGGAMRPSKRPTTQRLEGDKFTKKAGGTSGGGKVADKGQNYSGESNPRTMEGGYNKKHRNEGQQVSCRDALPEEKHEGSDGEPTAENE